MGGSEALGLERALRPRILIKRERAGNFQLRVVM